MLINRRHFIKGLATTMIASSGGLLSACSHLTRQQWLVSTCSDFDGGHFAAAVDQNGQVVSKVALPARGHDSVALPHKLGHALVFARRPDRYVMEIDFKRGQIVAQVESEPNSHFYGHGALSEDGQYLFTTENHIEKGHGQILVRDTKNYQVLERFHSGGIGPHEAALMPDGKTLVIANGGIQTHPDWPRMKLNLNSMQPNLSYLDIATGSVIDSFAPPHHHQSIRHLDVRQDGKVFIGIQYQGKDRQLLPLVYAHKGEANLVPFHADDKQWQRMKNYTASLLVEDKLLCVTCPRGGHISFWHADNHEFIDFNAFSDVAGLSREHNQIVASNGQGTLRNLASGLSPSQRKDKIVSGLRFDNHMTTIFAS